MVNYYKIPADDPDLQMFEMYIAENHPQIKQLRVDNQPSYEHPKFYELSFATDDLPGNENPLSVFAMNLFGLEDAEDYYWECQTLLERPISQLVKDDELEFNVRSEMHRIMNTSKFPHPWDNEQTTMSKELLALVEHCCLAWEEWLAVMVKAQLPGEEALFTQEHLNNVTEASAYVTEQLIVLAKLNVLNEGQFEHLRVNQKYALLAKSLLQIYQEKIVTYVQEYVDELQAHLFKTMGYEKLIRINSKRYVDIVLFYQIGLCSAELEMEHTGVKCPRSKEIKSPNDFIYTRLHGGYKAADIRVSYRWLFIKVWLYSWLKVNDVSANKAARFVAEDDRFFYLDKRLRRLGRKDEEGLVETNEQCYTRRQKQLNSEFSLWKKYKGPFTYISNNLFKKSERGYEKQQASE
ncbi:hypothetical protein BCT96_014480 [Vibrio splendidus]|uniref:hypothetical protein n=1 Tax=Vibrio splendidus TaxID=29497 RepID=UPI000C8291BC|nr:hypothetical protein [Vibrio splendidus]PMI79106.1 hypothetical protein BCU37_18830 [Vibrio splendidus]PMK56309.1 hypothetical protein BCT96_18995 [Vibrio splendidus]